MKITKVYIEKKFNPLAASLSKIIKKERFQITNKIRDAGIIISFAYHNEDDILEMETMGEVIKKNKSKKVVFLSWFDPVENFDKYNNLFSPEKPTCILMDTSKYIILQLPVCEAAIVNSIRLISKSK